MGIHDVSRGGALTAVGRSARVAGTPSWRAWLLLPLAALLVACGAEEPGSRAKRSRPDRASGARAESPAVRRPPPDRPHVVLLIIDTLRADYLGSYSGRKDVSPFLDQLAGEGVRFDRAIAASSWTRSSIGAMLTSRHPRTLGIQQVQRGALPEEEQTLAEQLQGAGYRTIGATANPHLNRSFAFDQGFEVYRDSSASWQWMPDADPTLGERERPPMPPSRELFRWTLAQVREDTEAGSDSPLYLQLNVMDVHQHFPASSMVRAPFQKLFPALRSSPPLRLYVQALRQVDEDFQWFLGELGEMLGGEDLLTVVVSDHGEGLESHPDVPSSRWHGHLLYESQVRVPWLLHHGGALLPSGRVVEEPVRMLDLMPTLLDLLELPVPEGLAGSSLWPAVRDGAPAGPSGPIVVETRAFGREKIGVYDGPWKYLENRDHHEGLPPVELQPRGLENGARTDRAADQPEVLERLRAFLADWEQRHPVAPARTGPGALDEETLRVLEQIGYTDH